MLGRLKVKNVVSYTEESFRRWSVTRSQATLLNQGYSIWAVEEHDEWLVHHGGKSGKAWQGARGMQTSPEEVRS